MSNVGTKKDVAVEETKSRNLLLTFSWALNINVTLLTRDIVLYNASMLFRLRCCQRNQVDSNLDHASCR